MKNRRNSNKLFWNNMNLTFPPNFRLFSELVFFSICLLYPFSIQWTNSKYHRCSTTKILLSKMWSFSYHVANFFTNWWTISFRDVTVHFLNQVFAISNYASLQCYDTVSRTTCTALCTKATTQFCKMCKLHYGSHFRSKLVHWNESVYYTPIDRALKMQFNEGSGSFLPPTISELLRFL